jgi:hypothetical protein
MASTYTTNLRLTKQADGENPNSWGQILNDGVISLADQAIAGYAEVSIGSAATVNLTANDGANDQSRNAFLKITGSIGAAYTSIFLVIPNKSKSYSILNAVSVSAGATGSVVIMRVAGSIGVTLGRSSTTFQHVVCDGASVRSANLLNNNVCVADNLFVGNATNIGGTCTIGGAVQLNSTVCVSGAAIFKSTVTVAGAANFKSTVTVEGAQVNTGTTRFEGAVSIGVSGQDAAAVHQPITTIIDAASIVMDMATNNQFLVTLGGNRTLAAPTNLTVGQTGHIYAIQNVGGGHTLSYNTVFKFVGGSDPVATPAAGAVNLLVFSVRATDKVDAVMINDLK